MKTIIAGSRGGIKYSHVAEAVNKCGWEITEIVSGCAAGADSLGEAYAKEKNIPVKNSLPIGKICHIQTRSLKQINLVNTTLWQAIAATNKWRIMQKP